MDTHADNAPPAGTITLTSDFGLRDPFVGVMKGRILDRFPAARIVDLTHDIAAHRPAEAGFWLSRSYRWFPPGTVHVAVVDPGVGTARDIVLLESQGHRLLAPDNGLLEPAQRADPASRAWRVNAEGLSRCGIGRVSATFHGRDIFAPIAAELAAGRVVPAELGNRVDRIVPSWVDAPSVTDGRIVGQVITIDHFGNLITDIDARLLRELREPWVHAAGRVLPLRRTYGDCTPGSPLALVNSFDVLEIAVAEGRAVDTLGLSWGAPVIVVDGVRRN